MHLLQIKTIIVNFRKLKLRNLYFMLFTPGVRGKEAVLLGIGNFYYRLRSGSKINIKKGSLIINDDFSEPNPFIGVLKMNENSELAVDDTFVIHSSCHILINSSAKLNLGSGYIHRNSKIRCFHEINIGNDVAISENFTIWDTDAHTIVGKENNITKPVNIGNHVWIGTNVTVLKGVNIGNGAVIAAGSVVTNDIPPRTLAGGVPAKILKENIDWR